MDANEKQQFYFTQLVLMFHTATMHQLGKLKNPMTGEIERDLVAAQNSIDILDMLRDKTKGNLTENESRMLTSVIQELKLNYVDEANRKPEEPKKSPEGTGKQPEPEPKSPPPADTTAPPEGEKPQ